MKYLLIALILVGCSDSNTPKFKAGDCVIIEAKLIEVWEKQEVLGVYKIKTVGKRKYLMDRYHLNYWGKLSSFETTWSFWLTEDFVKIDCSKVKEIFGVK